MKAQSVWGIAGTLLLLGHVCTARADGNSLKADLSVQKIVIQADGKEQRTAADAARPGDTLEYRVTYRNTNSKAARNIEATLPVPANLQYLKGTAIPQGAHASLDGAHYEAIPLKRLEKDANGKPKLQEVPYGEYRYLRWSLGELKPGETKTVSARMTVP